MFEGAEGIKFMGGSNLGKILNGFDNYLHIDYNTMPKRNLLAEYTDEYVYNKTKVDKLLEARAILNQNEVIKKYITKLYEDNLYPDYSEVQKLEKSLKIVPSVPSGIKDMKEPGDMSDIDLHRYFGLEIFHDAIMLNISPNWKGESSSLEHRCRIEFLKIILDKFFNDANRFTRYKYVIECGKEGNHTHCHAVFEINPNMSKSVNTWLAKANHSRDLRAIWKKCSEGIEGAYEGVLDSKHSIQKIILRTRKLRDDKLDYLIEDLKPLSHQNATHEYYPVLGGNWD